MAAGLGIAACSASAGTPHVASLGTKSASASGKGSGKDAATRPKGNPTKLLDEWASCMRKHGDPNQSDPTIGANKVIDIYMSPSIRGGAYGYSGEYGPGGPGLHCRAYLTAAQTALGGNQAQPKVSEAKLLKLAECMRANGVHNFPDPSGDNLSFPVNAGGDLSLNSPVFQHASKVCYQRTGVKLPGNGPPPPGTIEMDGSLPGGANG